MPGRDLVGPKAELGLPPHPLSLGVRCNPSATGATFNEPFKSCGQNVQSLSCVTQGHKVGYYPHCFYKREGDKN